jgi:type II secretory pathway pseudopilin PulG
MHGWKVQSNDNGETLLELVISLAILGVSVVAIVSGIALSIKGSVINRNEASASAYVRDFAEAIETAVSGAAYTACATTSTTAYSSPTAPGYSAPPSPFTTSLVKVEYWSGSGWNLTGCTPSNDTGVQRLTLQVSSGTGTDAHSATETLVIIIRKPCGTGSSCT